MESTNTSGLSRRSFLAGAGVAVAGAAVAGLAGCAAEGNAATASAADTSSASAPWMPESWDIETDVVVLGTGSVISAPLRAHDLGLEVLVLEKQPELFGGTTYFSGGALSCPNSRLALEAGKPEIPREDLLAYMKQCAKGQYKEEVLEALLDNYNTTCDYLIDDCGYEFSYVASETPYYAWYTPFFANEPKPGTSCTIWPVPVNDLQFGRALAEYGRMAIDDRGVEVRYNTKGKKLIYTGEPNLGNGEVIGIIAEDLATGQDLYIKARHGVVLGTGGYDFNREMVQNYLPGPIYSSISVNTNEGDGHIMAMELGAEMRNMNEPFRYPFIMTQGTDVYQGIDVNMDTKEYGSEQISKMSSSMVGKTGSLIVNKKGFRMGNESSPYAQFPRVFDVYDTGSDEFGNIPGYWICDQAAYDLYSLPGMAKQAFQTDDGSSQEQELAPWVSKYDSLDALAADKGIDLENLQATIERFNGFAETGVDKDFRRGEATFDQWTFGDTARVDSGELKNSCLAPIGAGPYYCVEYYPGMLQTAGGVTINENGQAMNVQGEPIPRLYVASCTMAMPLGKGYGWAGGTITPGFVFGYLAAEHLATIEPWEKNDE